MTMTQTPLPLPLPTANVTSLNEKATLVRLSRKLPSLSKRDRAAETYAQTNLQDSGLRVTSNLFAAPGLKGSTPRLAIVESGRVYTHHMAVTLAFAERGARLLPLTRYQKYRKEMRDLIDKVEARVAEIEADPKVYDDAVAHDMAYRGARAKLSDYPTADEFCASLQLSFSFAPLPESKHFLFDLSPEDVEALNEANQAAIEAAQRDAVSRLQDAVAALRAKLEIQIGKEGSIFRDATFEAVGSIADDLKDLGLDDLMPAIKPLADATAAAVEGCSADALRSNPSKRNEVAKELCDVERKAKFLFGF